MQIEWAQSGSPKGRGGGAQEQLSAGGEGTLHPPGQLCQTSGGLRGLGFFISTKSHLDFVSPNRQMITLQLRQVSPGLCMSLVLSVGVGADLPLEGALQHTQAWAPLWNLSVQQTSQIMLMLLVVEQHFEKASFNPRRSEWGLGNYLYI